MGIRQDQCNKVCRIIDDYLAERTKTTTIQSTQEEADNEK